MALYAATAKVVSALQKQIFYLEPFIRHRARRLGVYISVPMAQVRLVQGIYQCNLQFSHQSILGIMEHIRRSLGVTTALFSDVTAASNRGRSPSSTEESSCGLCNPYTEISANALACLHHIRLCINQPRKIRFTTYGNASRWCRV